MKKTLILLFTLVFLEAMIATFQRMPPVAGQTQPEAPPEGDSGTDADDATSSPAKLSNPKLWFGLPGHLDNEACAKEIADLFGSPTAELKRVLELATVVELRCTALKRGALADDKALAAVLDALAKYHVQLVVRVGVLGRSDKNGFRHDLDALKRVEDKGHIIYGIICESVLSSAKEHTGLDKGEQVDDRSGFVADAAELIREALGHDLTVYIGDTSLAQGQKPNRQDKYDFAEDSTQLIKINTERDIKIAGFIEAFNSSRMSKDAREITAAAKHLASLKCEAGIIPINDETDPQRYQKALVEQTKTICSSAQIDWIVSSNWSRADAVPTFEQHLDNTLAMIDAITK